MLYGDRDDCQDSFTVYTVLAGTPKHEKGHEEGAGSELVKPSETSQICRLRLFKLDMVADGSLNANVLWLRKREGRSVRAGFYLAFKPRQGNDLTYQHVKTEFSQQSQTSSFKVEAGFDLSARLVEFGVYCETAVETSNPLPLINVQEIRILKASHAKPKCSINNIRQIRTGATPYQHTRIAWEWHQFSADSLDTGVPHSDATWPFSHFVVWANEVKLGESFASEFVMQDGDWRSLGEDTGDMDVVVEGMLFGGGSVLSTQTRMLRED